MRIVDFHTHAFPDELAHRAMPYLEQEAEIRACLDGTVGSLKASMADAGISLSVVSSIATRPSQFRSILAWSRLTECDTLTFFPSVHPDDPEAAAQIRIIAEEGFKGIKLHPYYQEFILDEDRMFPLYEEIQKHGLVLLVHTGFDIAYERIRVAGPERIVRVIEAFPALKLVASHLGAWEDWGRVQEHLVGRPLYMDVSYSFDFVGEDRAREIILDHPAEYVLFGSDSPWGSQPVTLERLKRMGLPSERFRAIVSENACRLLGRELAHS